MRTKEIIKIARRLAKPFRVSKGKHFQLKDVDPNDTLEFTKAADKNSAIKHVMSGVNPQGCQVFSFKSPSSEELDHDYLWRCMKCLPNRGNIGIFNRSYYEE